MTSTWRQSLESVTLKDLLTNNEPIISAKTTDSPIAVLKSLLKNKLSSLALWDETKQEYVGFIDMVDLVTTVVTLCETKNVLDGITNRESDWYEYMSKEEELFKSEVVGTFSNASNRDPWCDVWEGKPLLSLLDMFSQEVNLHRVGVSNDQGKITAVMTQSRVIRHLAEDIKRFPEVGATLVSKFVKKCEVLTMTPQETALVGMQRMLERNVSSIAVVDPEGKLHAVLTPSDMKRSMEVNLFSDLYLPVALYLDKGNENFKDQSHTPITCTVGDTLAQVLTKLVTHDVHRLFVVDAENKPTGVLSLGDLISVFESV
eukprot:TRINITY_DN4178_c0_g4_i2.p1 TRINITY_DN4178_c0_g4~~TRINITY_DN4178_c0_g4_i2.p1  ORF type:complete len:316 (+),score=65.04 TRINITY_DN4178_c0_g4_i2:75-1022(+)